MKGKTKRRTQERRERIRAEAAFTFSPPTTSELAIARVNCYEVDGLVEQAEDDCRKRRRLCEQKQNAISAKDKGYSAAIMSRHREPLSAAREEDTCSFVTSQDAAGRRALATN